MIERPYYEDSYRAAFAARVVERRMAPGRPAGRLDSTALR